jgi:hypothetical protein
MSWAKSTRGRRIRPETISRELRRLRSRRQPQPLNENVRGGLVAFAKREVENQLRVALNRDERVGVPKLSSGVCPYGLRDSVFRHGLCSYVPDLVSP